MTDVTFDYADLPNIMAGYKKQFHNLSSAVEVRMIEKAKFLAKKINPNCDQTTFRKLNEESKFIQDVAQLIDQSRTMYEFFENAALQTQDDWLTHAINGKKMKENMDLLRDTVSSLKKREDTYMEILKSVTKKLNEQQGLRPNDGQNS